LTSWRELITGKTARSIGQDHPYVAYSFREHANLYRDNGPYGEAEILYQRSLEIFEKNMGPDHPNVVETLEQYARLLRKINRTDEAESLEAGAKTIREKVKQEIASDKNSVEENEKSCYH
jgi:tetratricopeptide (TPR) repeat protein